MTVDFLHTNLLCVLMYQLSSHVSIDLLAITFDLVIFKKGLFPVIASKWYRIVFLYSRQREQRHVQEDPDEGARFTV